MVRLSAGFARPNAGRSRSQRARCAAGPGNHLAHQFLLGAGGLVRFSRLLVFHLGGMDMVRLFLDLMLGPRSLPHDGCYANGEAAGTHGVTRPGGAALNSGQVFGTRCAEHIASRQADP